MWLQDPELAIASPTPERLSLHLISQCGKEESVLAGYGRDPRLLTLAADVLGLCKPLPEACLRSVLRD